MDEPGEEFFACSGFSLEKDRGVGRGYLRGQVKGVPHGLRANEHSCDAPAFFGQVV
jgi:hypothetical protein